MIHVRRHGGVDCHLEDLGPDENPVIVSIEPPPRVVAAQISPALNTVERTQPHKQTLLRLSVLDA